MSLNKKRKVNQEPVDEASYGDFCVENDDYYTDYSYLDLDDSVIKKAEEKSFPDEKIELLIEAVKQKPALWNVKHEGYKNRVIRNNLWEQVLSELNLDSEFKRKTQKRWDTLKTGYGRSKNDPSGSGAKPTYKFGQLLCFLDDTREPRCTTSLMMSADNPPESESIVKTYSKKKNSPKSKEKHNFQLQALQILKDINSPKPEESNGQSEKTFAALTCELIQRDMETLPEVEQRSLRTQLFAVVDDAVRRYRSAGK